MAWKSWKKWVGYAVEYGGKMLPGFATKATDAIADDLQKAERERKEREAAAKKESDGDVR